MMNDMMIAVAAPTSTPIAIFANEGADAFDLGPGDDRKEQCEDGHGEAVVQAGFNVEGLTDADWHRRVGNDRFTERCVGRGKDRGDQRGLRPGEIGEQRSGHERAEPDRQRQSDRKKPGRKAERETVGTCVDSSGVGEQQQRKSELGEEHDGFVFEAELNDAEHLRSENESGTDVEHRWREREHLESFPEEGNAGEQNCKDGEIRHSASRLDSNGWEHRQRAASDRQVRSRS
jgi:hypothetical protein